MNSPTKVKEVQKLTNCVAALNRFVARATNQCAPFFEALKKEVKFSWIDDCKAAFQGLKDYLERALLLFKPQNGERLLLYLVVSEVAVSAVLMCIEEGNKLPMYYVIKALLDPETCYSNAEKICWH